MDRRQDQGEGVWSSLCITCDSTVHCSLKPFPLSILLVSSGSKLKLTSQRTMCERLESEEEGEGCDNSLND